MNKVLRATSKQTGDDEPVDKVHEELFGRILSIRTPVAIHLLNPVLNFLAIKGKQKQVLSNIK